MNWVNCDRFMDIPAIAKTTFIVYPEGRGRVSSYLIFKNRNAVAQMYSSRKENGLIFNGFPKTVECQLFAMKIVNNRIMIGLQDVTGKESTSITFKLANIGEVRKIMQGMDA